MAGQGRVDVQIDGKLFTSYHYEGVPKPALYPVRWIDGTGMTRRFPMEKALPGESNDHAHHRSVFWGHRHVKGGENDGIHDFWGENSNSGKQVSTEVKCGENGAIHLFERDCSIQRRHQKILEEAGSPAINAKQRDKIGQTVCDALSELGYRNAGTVEFLYEEGQFYFIEMNMGHVIKLGKPFYLTLTYVVIFPGLASFFFWIKGIALIGANRAGVFLHLMPIFGAIMAMIIFDEKFMFYHFLGAIFIIAGITLSNKKTINNVK